MDEDYSASSPPWTDYTQLRWLSRGLSSRLFKENNYPAGYLVDNIKSSLLSIIGNNKVNAIIMQSKSLTIN